MDYSSFLSDDTYVIFLFHGVIPAQKHAVRNYTRKHLPLDDFTGIIKSLQAGGNAASMEDVVRATNGEGELPPRAFVITFDDGFENNYSVAAPALADLGVPATYYVTSGFIQDNSGSWIDLIEYAVELRDRVTVSLPYDGLSGTFTNPQEKIGFLDRVRAVVKGDKSIDPYDFAAELWRQLDVRELMHDHELDQKMSWEQVRKLSDHPLFIVGGHSHTHRIMSYLDPAALKDEVETSLRLLQDATGEQPTHYSYPEGLTFCYSDQVIHELRSRGIVCSPSAEHGVNKLGDDLFHLKRVMVT
jgi:peptidoglycan/xylan/chitin deacetylase (PgdA/CDA1 family)